MIDIHKPQPTRENPSYYRKEPLIVTERMREEIRGAFAEIDMDQIKILKKMTPTERFLQACATNHAVNRVAVYQLLRREPDLDENEAWQIVHSGKVIQRALQKKKERDARQSG